MIDRKFQVRENAGDGVSCYGSLPSPLCSKKYGLGIGLGLPTWSYEVLRLYHEPRPQQRNRERGGGNQRVRTGCSRAGISNPKNLYAMPVNRPPPPLPTPSFSTLIADEKKNEKGGEDDDFLFV